MPHDTRAKVDPRYPLQVTIRAVPGLPSLRSARVFGALRRAIGRASVDRFRVIHFSIQQDHGHFIVEGDEARRARGGMHGLAIRLALAVNRALGRRKGKVVGDRYHVRPLTTPRQMRTSMVYVLLNYRKHLRAPAGVDPRSSGPHFSGWDRSAQLDSADVASRAADWARGRPAATVAATTWMGTIGWRRAGGLLKVEERPAASRRARLTCRSPPGLDSRGCWLPARVASPAAGDLRAVAECLGDVTTDESAALAMAGPAPRRGRPPFSRPR